MSKHPHAEKMIQYGHDAMGTASPWERWEVKSPRVPGDEWAPLDWPPGWHPSLLYRRKPATVTARDFTLPKPETTAPCVGTNVYVVRVHHEQGDRVRLWAWEGDDQDFKALRNGSVHLTRESAEQWVRFWDKFAKGVL